jgi:hypothetical protein
MINVCCGHNFTAFLMDTKPIFTNRIAALDSALDAPPLRIIAPLTGARATIYRLLYRS